MQPAILKPPVFDIAIQLLIVWGDECIRRRVDVCGMVQNTMIILYPP